MIFPEDVVKITITTEDVQSVLTAVNDIEVLLVFIVGLLCFISGILCAWLFWRRMH